MSRLDRQRLVVMWGTVAFGKEHMLSAEERAYRLVEEAVEAAQAVRCDPDKLWRIIEHVYARPPGDIRQELGGVGICTLALAQAVGMDADTCEYLEINRVLALPVEHFTKRNEEKKALGFKAENMK